MQIYFEQEGSLAAISLAHLLKSLCDRSETGMLTLQREEVRKSIYFNQGRIVFAASNQESDRLGVFLFRHGKLSLEAFEQSSALMTPSRRHGQILVEMGVISRQSLNWAVKEQVKEIIMSLFAWDRGTYSFVSMDPLEGEPITLKAKTLDLILEGTRRITDWGVIRRAVGPPETCFAAREEGRGLVRELYVKPREKEVLRALERPASVREVCARLESADFEICRTLMGFDAIGVVERVPAPAPAR